MTRPLFLPIVLLALFASTPAGAQSNTDIINYLNANFGGKVWPQVQDLIGNNAIHEVSQQLLDDPMDLRLNRGQTTFDMSAPPGFSMRGNDLVARFPASGVYEIDGSVDFHTGFFGIVLSFGLHVDLSIEAVISATDTDVTIDLEVDLSGLVGDLAQAVRSMEEVENRARRTLGNNLGFIRELIFDAAAPLTYDVPDVELIHGHPDIGPDGAVDIMLVADGFRAADLSDFHAMAAAFANKIVTEDTATRVSEPFASFDTAIRVWKINALNVSQTDGEQAVSSFSDPITGTTKTTMKNLARLARIGIFADQLGADVLVFVSSPLNHVRARASAFGNLVLLPADPSRIATTASVLVHELGHTVLGQLADEYVEASKENTMYMGLEPANSNVASLFFGLTKWTWWVLNPQEWMPWDTPVVVKPGAYYFGGGIFRPRETCKMFDSDDDEPFCQVCREAITRGIRDVVADNMALVELEYSSPWTEPADTVYLETAAQSAHVDLEAYNGSRRTELRLSLLATSLPRPLDVHWRYLPPAGGMTGQRSLTGEVAHINIELGGRIELTIGSQCGYVPRDRIDDFVVTFDVSIPRVPTVNPLPPYDLAQAPAVGTQIPITYDAATGDVQFNLSLEAKVGGFAAWDLQTALEFSIKGSENRTYTTPPRDKGTQMVHAPGVLQPGLYTWSVRTVFGSRRSSWARLPFVFAFESGRFVPVHFEVLPPAFASKPRAPHAPVDLIASGPPSFGGQPVRTIELFATSWDLNGDPLMLEFEIQPETKAFTGIPSLSTGWLQGTLESLRVRDSVVVGPLLDRHKWQVRAKDSTGSASVWVYGGLISSFINEPINLLPRDDRLDLFEEPIDLEENPVPPDGPFPPIDPRRPDQPFK